MGSGGSWIRGGVAEEGVDLSEILEASVGHSEVSLKLGHSGLKGEDLVFHCRRLRFTGGAGRVPGIFLKPVFRYVEGGIGCFEDFEFGFEGAHVGRGAS